MASTCSVAAKAVTGQRGTESLLNNDQVADQYLYRQVSDRGLGPLGITQGAEELCQACRHPPESGQTVDVEGGVDGPAGRPRLHRGPKDTLSHLSLGRVRIGFGQREAKFSDGVGREWAGIHTVSIVSDCNQPRSLASAKRSLDFTVPSGTPSAWATSWLVIPCQKVSSTARCCPIGSRSMAWRTTAAEAAESESLVTDVHGNSARSSRAWRRAALRRASTALRWDGPEIGA